MGVLGVVVVVGDGTADEVLGRPPLASSALSVEMTAAVYGGNKRHGLQQSIPDDYRTSGNGTIVIRWT